MGLLDLLLIGVPILIFIVLLVRERRFNKRVVEPLLKEWKNKDETENG